MLPLCGGCFLSQSIAVLYLGHLAKAEAAHPESAGTRRLFVEEEEEEQ